MPVMLQLPGAFDLQPLIEASVCSDIFSPFSSCPGTSELLEIVSTCCLELPPDRVLLGDQLVLLCTARQRNDPIELGCAQIEIPCTQGSEAVADRPLLVDLKCTFGEDLLDRLDRVLVKIRRDLLDC